MARPRVTIVGLGPSDEDHLSPVARRLLTEAGDDGILRTSRHPAAASLGPLASYDALYDAADSFDEVYQGIVDDLVRRATTAGHVVYGVPGSPLVAERTVELLRGRDEVSVDLIPAVSFVDLLTAALGVDVMASELRVVDALSIGGRLRGPGPIIVAQCHSVEVLSAVKLSIDADLFDPRPTAVILHHLGLPDEQVIEVDVDDLDRFREADHLTSVFLPELRTVGPAAEDLVDLMARLREDCPWDRKQTHGSLTRHLLEEAYEALEALEGLAVALESDADDVVLDAAYAHAQEELGDLIFQVVFHAHLAAEDGRFDLAGVLDGVRTKLVGRHPHVFGDVVAETADDVAVNWEAIKRSEKGRSSVTEGIPGALPALLRYVKLRRKGAAVGLAIPSSHESLDALEAAIAQLQGIDHMAADDADSLASGEAAEGIGLLLEAAGDLSAGVGVDPEAALRRRADRLVERIIECEPT
jgi:tetrapyrrole methylase family protein/MazG family protein